MVRSVVLWVLLLTVPALSGAQAPEDAWPSEVDAGPFHSIIRVAPALRSGRPAASDILLAARAELELGRPSRARALLDRHRVADQSFAEIALELRAAAAFGVGAYEQAALLFQEAGEHSVGDSKGILITRAAVSWSEAGGRAQAARLFELAAQDLPAIHGWLAMRRARVTADTDLAVTLLSEPPRYGAGLAVRSKAERLVASGDTARAVAVLAAAGVDGRAAALALAVGDSAGARQLAYRALGDPDHADVGVRLADENFPPAAVDEYLALAHALRWKSARRAAQLVARAIAAGDSSSGTLRRWGDYLVRAGSQTAALSAYARAAEGVGSDAVMAELSRARTLIRLRRPIAASRALQTFVDNHSSHSRAPFASYLLADLADDLGRGPKADSLYRVVTSRWPRHEYAGQARFRQASLALSRGDTSGARVFYEAEIELGGERRLAARFLLAGLSAASGDEAGAAARWGALARVDSVGYYGVLARDRLGWPAPAFDPPERPETPADLAAAFAQVDLLDEIGLAAEANSIVRGLVAEVSRTKVGMLDVAELVTQRGRVSQGITLGWRASSVRGLNDARVLRAIYPWPRREVVLAEAQEFGLDPYLVAALIRQESGFMPEVRSRAGARGMMQLMPPTAREVARRMGVEWSDNFLVVPDANIHVGAGHLATLLRHYRGSLVLSLAAYNAGMRPVERWRRRYDTSDLARFVERIPYAETRGYVRAVLRNRGLYRALYPSLTDR